MEITVAATARASLPPERATLTLRVTFDGQDKAHALGMTTAIARELTTRLRALEADESGPTTSSTVLPISVHSQRPYSHTGELLPLQHTASATMRVTFADFDALAEFVGDVGGTDGVAVEGVEWALTDATRERIEAAVLADAVERARSRATTMAHAAGALDLQFAQIADPGLLGEPAPQARHAMELASAAMMDGAGGIELAPEDIVIETTLHVRFTAT